MPDRDGPGDPSVPLSRLRAKLAGPRGYRKLEALLSRTDAAAVIAGLPVPELYGLVKEVGFSESQELLALATPEQLRGCLDADIWDRDRVQLEAAKPWLLAVMESGFEKTGQVWERLDTELAALILQRWTRIYDLSLEEDPEEEERELLHTPDTFFAVALISDDEETNRITQRLIEDLYRADLTLARHTLMAARSEPPAELEEMSYRWRSGRMADLGYADFYEALEVFRPIDTASVDIGEGTEDRFDEVPSGEEARAPGELPVVFTERIIGRSFLARAIGAIEEAEEATRLETAFVVLSNRVLAALRIRLDETESIQAGTDYAIATIALGLEVVAKGDVDRATSALGSISLSRIHRVGYSAMLRLARFAHLITPRAVTAPDPTAAVLESLQRARPWFARELDDPPLPGELRPFESLDDLRRAARFLTELALMIAVADAVGVDLLAAAKQPEPRPEIGDHIRTALVRAMSGGALEPSPLRPAEATLFREQAVVAGTGTLSAAATELASTRLGECLDTAKVTNGRELLPHLLAGWLEQIATAFADLAPDQALDPRFFGCVILAADRD